MLPRGVLAASLVCIELRRPRLSCAADHIAVAVVQYRHYNQQTRSGLDPLDRNAELGVRRRDSPNQHVGTQIASVR